MGRLESYPRDGCVVGFESLSYSSYVQRNCEEIKCIPSPSQKAHEEHEPLVTIEFTKDGIRISEFGQWRLETCRARKDISSYLLGRTVPSQ